MGNFGATKRQGRLTGWAAEKLGGSRADGKVGYWTHEQMVEMDHRALARMIAVHPDLCPPRIREAIKNFANAPKTLSVPLAAAPETPPEESAEDFLGRLFMDDGLDDESTEADNRQTRRAYVETANAIRHAVAEKHLTTVADLDSDCRTRGLVFARHEAFYMVAAQTTLNYPRMGKMFGDRDHTTIIKGILSHCRRNNLHPPRGLANYKNYVPLDASCELSA